jgi:hypothetical protein
MRAHVVAAVEGLIAKYPGKTLRQVADIVRIEQPMLSAMRHGRSIGILALLKLRDATGDTLDDLLGLDPPREAKQPATPPPPAPPEVVLAGIEASLAELRRQYATQSSVPPAPLPPSPPKGALSASRPRRR